MKGIVNPSSTTYIPNINDLVIPPNCKSNDETILLYDIQLLINLHFILLAYVQ